MSKGDCKLHPEQLCTGGACWRCEYVEKVQRKTIKEELFKTITDGEIKTWCDGTFTDYTFDRLRSIIIGEYDLNEAREDILSFRKESGEKNDR